MPHHLYLDWGGPDAHNVRDPEGLLSDLPAIGTALLGVLAGLWLRGHRAAKPTAMGLAAACRDLPGAGLSVVARISAQQKYVDELVCAGGGGLFADGAHAFVLDDGRVGMGRRAEQRAGVSMAGVRLECDHGLHVQRDCAGAAGADRICGRRQNHKRAGVAGRSCVHPHADAWMGGFCVFFLHSGVLLYSGWIMYRKKIFVKV